MYSDILDRSRTFKARVQVIQEHIIELDCPSVTAFRKTVLKSGFVEKTILERPQGKAKVVILGEISETPLPALSQEVYDRAVLRRLEAGQKLKPLDYTRAIVAGGYYDPVLNPTGLVHIGLVDRTKAMPDKPWHGWAVLAEAGGYRVHAGGDQSPTLHETPQAAWTEFEGVEQGVIEWPEHDADED